MRYILPILMMIAVTNLGCRRWWPRRSARDAGPKPANAEPETRPLSELAPQPTKPKPPESSGPAAQTPQTGKQVPALGTTYPVVKGDTFQPSPRPAPTPGATYTVVKGDTFWSIAQQAYGDGKLWTKIKQANPGVDANDLNVGRVIKIPPK